MFDPETDRVDFMGPIHLCVAMRSGVQSGRDGDERCLIFYRIELDYYRLKMTLRRETDIAPSAQAEANMALVYSRMSQLGQSACLYMRLLKKNNLERA